MAERPAGTGRLRFTLMLSLEPATLGADGYREIFQVGETLDDLPLIDRQHPHDFLMQAAVVWRTPLGRGYSLTLAGAPVGEPALGPVTFMHRASAFENPTAPLAHHTFDSTHIAMGVLTAGLDRGRVASRRLALSWRRAGRAALGPHGPGSARLVVGARLVPPDERVDAAGVARFSEDAGSARAGRRAAHDGIGVVVAPARRTGGRLRPSSTGATTKSVATSTPSSPKPRTPSAPTALYGRVESLQVESDVLRFGEHTFVGTARSSSRTSTCPRVAKAVTW